MTDSEEEAAAAAQKRQEQIDAARESLEGFLKVAGTVARSTYEQLSGYPLTVEQLAEQQERLRKAGDRLADDFPDQFLLDSGARALNDAGVVAFRMANRALDAQDRDEFTLADESARFFRRLGAAWLRSTMGSTSGPSGVAPTDRVRTVELHPARTERGSAGPTIWHEGTFALVNRNEQSVAARIVPTDLLSGQGDRIGSDAITISDAETEHGHLELVLHRDRNTRTISVRVEGDTTPGTYRGLLTVAARNLVTSVMLTLTVAPKESSGGSRSHDTASSDC